MERADVDGWTVLSEADEREIVQRRDRGQTFRAIAIALGNDVAALHRAYQRLRIAGKRAGVRRHIARPAQRATPAGPARLTTL